MALSVPHSSLLEDIHREVFSSASLQLLVHQFQVDPAAMPHHTVRDGKLFWHNRLVIPTEARGLIIRILQEFHSYSIDGHAGFLRTHTRIATYFFWQSMRQDIRDFIRHCQICQRAKSCQTNPSGLLTPLSIPHQVWEDVAMDFITGLPLSKGFSVIFVVIDRLSKFAHFAPLRSTFTTPQVAEVFLNTVVKLHGIPSSIVSDRDKTFTSSFWRHLFKLQGTSLRMSSAYHPQTDGQSKALNKCLEMYLCCFVSENPSLSVSFLPWAELWNHHSVRGHPTRARSSAVWAPSRI
ncbi:Ribonuclease H-like superfamily [Sesbania bispinosa]|nr:Ribonuclease H-like superfamily [Sesbania bispinosa]